MKTNIPGGYSGSNSFVAFAPANGATLYNNNVAVIGSEEVPTGAKHFFDNMSRNVLTPLFVQISRKVVPLKQLTEAKTMMKNEMYDLGTNNVDGTSTKKRKRI